MKHLFSILALLIMTVVAVPSVLGQCTISNPIMYNVSTTSGITSFNMKFTHTRNAGNKWITIHLWGPNYPSYGYGSVPTTSSLGGVSKVPFGTIVINNQVVDHSGTYTSAQAFVLSYQNDATFTMATGAGSSLTYDAGTGLYTLTILSVTLPTGTTIIKADGWSSQASSNQVVHCFYAGISVVTQPLSVTGLETFKAITTKDDKVAFSWTTTHESNNAYFRIRRVNGADDYTLVGIVYSHTEDGNSSDSYTYSYTVDPHPKKYGSIGLLAIIVMCALFSASIKRMKHLRLVSIMAGMIWLGSTLQSCRRDHIIDDLSTKQATWYDIQQVDRDGKTSQGAARMVYQ